MGNPFSGAQHTLGKFAVSTEIAFPFISEMVRDRPKVAMER